MIQVNKRIQIVSEGLDSHTILFDGKKRGTYTTMSEAVDAICTLRENIRKKILKRKMGENSTFFADKIAADARKLSHTPRQWVAHSVYDSKRNLEKNRESRANKVNEQSSYSPEETVRTVDDLFDTRGT